MQTHALAARFAKRLKPGDVVALRGGLGAGKTAFVRGLAEGLGLDANEVCSPTYTLLNEYRGGSTVLYHFDMYRVTGEDELYSTGFFDCLEGAGIIAVEWSENIVEFLPDNHFTVSIEPATADASVRVIHIRDADL